MKFMASAMDITTVNKNWSGNFCVVTLAELPAKF